MSVFLDKIAVPKIAYVHAFGWMLFIIYEVTTIYCLTGKIESLGVFAFYYVLNILLFYGHLHVMSSTFKLNHLNIFNGLMMWLILISAFLAIKYFFNQFFLPNRQLFKSNGQFWKSIMVSFYRGGNFMIMATIYWVAARLAGYRKAAFEAEKKQLIALKEKAEVEAVWAKNKNAYLQQRLNPHLLFNSLTFIYRTVYKHSAQGAKAVELLSDILSYSLQAAGEDGKNLVANEIEQVENMVALNRSRYAEPLWIDVNIQGDCQQFRILPLILLTLTENIFKHGNLRANGTRALLHIDITPKGRLMFHTLNQKRAEDPKLEKTGIGLSSIRTRLDYAYANHYDLAIREAGANFELTLMIDL